MPQLPLAHCVPVMQLWPLFSPQWGCPLAAAAQMFVPWHGVLADGSTSPVMGKQVPAFCAWLQLKQVPSQASLQQTPSTQFSDTQSAALLQVLPFLLRHSP